MKNLLKSKAMQQYVLPTVANTLALGVAWSLGQSYGLSGNVSTIIGAGIITANIGYNFRNYDFDCPASTNWVFSLFSAFFSFLGLGMLKCIQDYYKRAVKDERDMEKKVLGAVIGFVSSMVIIAPTLFTIFGNVINHQEQQNNRAHDALKFVEQDGLEKQARITPAKHNMTLSLPTYRNETAKPLYVDQLTQKRLAKPLIIGELAV